MYMMDATSPAELMLEAATVILSSEVLFSMSASFPRTCYEWFWRVKCVMQRVAVRGRLKGLAFVARPFRHGRFLVEFVEKS